MPLPKCIKIQAAAKAGAPTQISIRGFIGSKLEKDWTISSTEDAVLAALKDVPDGDPIHVRINSKGGDFAMGLGVYNALSRRKNTTTFNDGFALSAGSVILAAGQRVVCPPTSVTMLHCASSFGGGNAAEKRKEAEMLDTCDQAMAAAYGQKMGKSKDEVLKLMQAETWWDGATAVKNKLADDDGNDQEPDNDPDDVTSEEERLVLASCQNIPENLRNRLVSVSANGGQRSGGPTTPKTPTKNMEKFIKALAARGITLPATATEDEILAAYDKMLNDMSGENQRHRDAQKARVTAKVKAAIEAKKIKAEREASLVAMGLADESNLDFLDDLSAPQASEPAPAPAPAPAPRAPRGNPIAPPAPAADGETTEQKINARLDRINALKGEYRKAAAARQQAIAKEIGQITAELGKIRGGSIEYKVTFNPLAPVQR